MKYPVISKNPSNPINYKEKEFTILLDSFLYNAGVVGLLNVLEMAGKISIEEVVERSKNSNRITLPLDKLDGFETDYKNAMLEMYKHTAKANQFVGAYESYSMDSSIENLKKMIIGFQIITDKNRNSPLHVFVLMPDAIYEGKAFTKDEKITFIKNCDTELKACNNLKPKKGTTQETIDEKYIALHEKYKTLIDCAYENREEFLMKDLSFTIFNSFFGEKAFTNKSNFSLTSNETYAKVFLDPLGWFVDKKIKDVNYQCSNCKADIDTKSGTRNGHKVGLSGYVWIRGLGVDSVKKKSMFWNFEQDDLLCPICAIVYSCIPFGFSVFNDYGNMAFFFNSNKSIRTLWQLNSTLKEKMTNIARVSKEDIFGVYLENFGNNLSEHDMKSIQSIRFENERYSVKTVSTYHLNFFREKHKELKSLRGYKFIIGKSGQMDIWLDVYQEAVKAILDGYSLNPLIHKVIMYNIKERKLAPYHLGTLLQLENYKNNIKRGESGSMNTISEKQLYFISSIGQTMKSKILSKSSDNKLKGYVYKLESLVRVNDKHRFISELSRMHATYEVELPTLLIKALNDDLFKTLGNAYIIGLLGSAKSNKE